MAVVEGSVTVITTSGPVSVQMPENDLDVVGFAPLGQQGTYAAPPLVGIYIDASNIAYFPMPQEDSYTVRKYTPIHVKVKGNVLNLNIPYGGPSGSGLTIFYGVPDGSEVEYTDLKGVPFAIGNTSTTAGASGTTSVTFPSGNVKISGFFAYACGSSTGLGNISFITGTGRSLSIPISASPDPMDLPDNIIPLDLSSATTLSLNYTIGIGAASFYGVIYYQ